MAEREVRWPRAWRIIASRYPPIDLFERVSPHPAVWEALIALEEVTNPRVRDAVGAIALVPPEDRVAGPGSSYVMASFTHVNPKGSRFGDGTYGVYYAARQMETAIAETIHHFERFARDSGDPPRSEDMRVLAGTVDNTFEDVMGLALDRRDAVLAPDSYIVARIWARSLWEAEANGVVYPSVRNAGGECLAAFKPRVVGPPVQAGRLRYRWNGERVDRYFDFSEDAWRGWPAPPAR